MESILRMGMVDKNVGRVNWGEWVGWDLGFGPQMAQINAD